VRGTCRYRYAKRIRALDQPVASAAFVDVMRVLVPASTNITWRIIDHCQKNGTAPPGERDEVDRAAALDALARPAEDFLGSLGA
jgi:hypothetical protein